MPDPAAKFSRNSKRAAETFAIAVRFRATQHGG
jgi:hypothetical protein